MFELVRSSSIRQLFARQLPGFLVSLAVAEAFYKFHSFTLECLAFLVTWFVIDGVFAVATGRLAARRPAGGEA